MKNFTYIALIGGFILAFIGGWALNSAFIEPEIVEVEVIKEKEVYIGEGEVKCKKSGGEMAYYTLGGFSKKVTYAECIIKMEDYNSPVIIK